jgi:hypothetical protein
VLFVTLNPNVEDNCDPTVNRCAEFAMSWGYTEMVLVNLFAYRTAEPRHLRILQMTGVDIVGPQNDDYIRKAVQECGIAVCAWGASADRYEERVAHVVRILRQWRPLQMIHRTKHGGPAHPLCLNLRYKPIMYMEQYA